MENGIFKLNRSDVWKALVTAFTTGLTVFIAKLYSALSEGGFPDAAAFKSIAAFSLAAALGYLMKNWLSSSQGNFLGIGDKKA